MNILSKISWGKPDSPMRALCGLCHGALPEVPLIIRISDGSAASFCDNCAEKIFRTFTTALAKKKRA
jgi:hypothetical protein